MTSFSTLPSLFVLYNNAPFIFCTNLYFETLYNACLFLQFGAFVSALIELYKFSDSFCDLVISLLLTEVLVANNFLLKVCFPFLL